MSESSGARRRVGETIREMGILVFVCAPLDVAFSGLPARPEDVAATMIGALAMIVAGILLETMRE